MTFVLGSVIAAALKTENVVRRQMLPSNSYSGLAIAYLDWHNVQLLQETIARLEKENEKLAQGVADHSPETKTLADQLDQYRFLAGITPVTGPGITVTLRDSAKKVPENLPSQVSLDMTLSFIIHDLDIQRVVNELRASGAEAFAVNDQRIVTTTAIRCVGPSIQVNGVPLTPPYIIRAIGDPTTLMGSLGLPGGIAEQLKQTDPSMITIQKSSTLELPGYDGSVMFRYCKPVSEVSSVSGGDNGTTGVAGGVGQ